MIADRIVSETLEILGDEFTVEECEWDFARRFLDILIVHRPTNWKFCFSIPQYYLENLRADTNAHFIAANLSANFLLCFPNWGQGDEEQVDLQALNMDEELGGPAWTMTNGFQYKPSLSNIEIAMQLGRFSNAEKVRAMQQYALSIRSSGT